MNERGLLDVVGLIVVCMCAVLAAVLELLLVPLYAGSVAVPVAAVLTIAGNAALPRLAYAFVPSGLAAAAPGVIWAAILFFFGLTSRPEGDVILPGGGGGWFQVTMYGGVIVGGVVAAVVSAVAVTTPRRPAQPQPQVPTRKDA